MTQSTPPSSSSPLRPNQKTDDFEEVYRITRGPEGYTMTVCLVRREALAKYAVRTDGPHSLEGAASKLHRELEKRFR